MPEHPVVRGVGSFVTVSGHSWSEKRYCMVKIEIRFFVLFRPETDAEIHVPNKIVSGLSSDQNPNLNHYEIVD